MIYKYNYAGKIDPNLFSKQEPAFEELILLYTKEVEETNAKDKAEVPSLQLKIYERIPIPDLPVIILPMQGLSDLR